MTDPCNQCTPLPCSDTCTCPEPVYLPDTLCDTHVPFGCVELLETGANNAPLSYPCLPFSTGKTLLDLVPILNTWKCDYNDKITKVRVSATDTTPGYLSQKLIGGDCISFQTINQGGNEQIRAVIDYDCVLSKLILLPAFCTAVTACTPLPVCAPTTNLTVV